MTNKNRGRPLKNDLKFPDFKPSPESLQEKLKEWDQFDSPFSETNWEEIVKKQETQLNVYITENDELAKICVQRWEEIQHLKYLITYLERRLENATV
ncbi:MAG: hypothetical protein RL373_9 [Pseudomonadota bacterium]|jgi:hypothetical protein